MKQTIITIAVLTVSVGAAILFLSHSSARRTRKPCMTFAELYEDNLCDGIGGLLN